LIRDARLKQNCVERKAEHSLDGALMAQGDGTHTLPVRAQLRKTIGKQAGDTVHVRIDERIG
jgi:hypothetical protein